MLLAVTVVPAMACSPTSPCTDNTGIELGVLNEMNIMGDLSMSMEKVTGTDRVNTIINAQQNSDIIDLKQKLITRGYIIKPDSACLVYKASLYNSTTSSSATIVEIPVKTHDSDTQGFIVWVKSVTGENAYAIIKGKVEKPINLLTSNFTFQKSLNTLKDMSFRLNIDQANVTEIITNTADQALITIPASNDTTSKIGVISLVDMNSNNVIGIVSPMSDDSPECFVCWTLAGFAYALPVLGCWGVCVTILLLTGPLGAACLAACAVLLGLVMEEKWTENVQDFCVNQVHMCSS